MEGFDKVADFFEQFTTKYHDELMNSMKAGMDIFLGMAIKKYYSGRPGVNRKSGRLANSWLSEQNNNTVSLFTDTKYAHVHEHENDFTGWIKPLKAKALYFEWNGSSNFFKKVFIPKRTDIIGYFNSTGNEVIQRSVNKKVEKIINNLSF